MCNQPQTVAGPGATRRGGFTLVELLVVILVVGMLAALVTPAVIQALTKARNTAIKAEIDMLHMAVMNYKNEYGSFPPAIDANYVSPTSPAIRHLVRCFPRAALGELQTELAALRPLPTGITPLNALTLWLEGYTKTPASPLIPPDLRQRLFDFDRSRIDAATQRYAPSGKPASPYIYIPASQYAASVATPLIIGGNSYSAVLRPNSAEFFNPDTFQILCAGRDEEWGDASEDDVSNFWPGTRREYFDSLKK